MVTKDGCTVHDVTHETTERWWAEVAKRDAVVSMCACCRGPCSIDSPVCKFCQGADIDALRRSWKPRA